MNNIDPIIEFILQVEKENKKLLSETEVRQVLSILVEKIEKLKGGKGVEVKSKRGKLPDKHSSKRKALKQLAAVKISKMKRREK